MTAAPAGAAVRRRWIPGYPVALAAILGPLRRGTGDPTWSATPDGAIWRTTRTPDGPGLERLVADAGSGSVELAAWGPGREWLADRLPRLLGAQDDPGEFLAPAPLRELQRRWSGWRVPRNERVLETLIPAILEQKVTSRQAWAGWRYLLRTFGAPAPAAAAAPPGLRVFPAPEVWRQIPSWQWHKAAVDPARSATVLRAAGAAGRVEECARLEPEAAAKRLRAIPGIGVWTVAETAQRALGDADAVSFGDFHIGPNVVYALTGRTDGDDEQMARLLRPYAGHRFRIQRLVELGRIARPRRGHRYANQDMRAF